MHLELLAILVVGALVALARDDRPVRAFLAIVGATSLVALGVVSYRRQSRSVDGLGRRGPPHRLR
jgi:hypothetical protein